MRPGAVMAGPKDEGAALCVLRTAPETRRLFRPEFQFQSDPEGPPVLWYRILKMRTGSGVQIFVVKDIPNSGIEFPGMSDWLDQIDIGNRIRGDV